MVVKSIGLVNTYIDGPFTTYQYLAFKRNAFGIIFRFILRHFVVVKQYLSMFGFRTIEFGNTKYISIDPSPSCSRSTILIDILVAKPIEALIILSIECSPSHCEQQ